MCPAHPEQFLDANLVTTTSLSERLRIWKKFAREPVDTETVRLEFFRKVRMGRLYQRCKRRIPMQNRVKVRTPLPQLLNNVANLFVSRSPNL